MRPKLVAIKVSGGHLIPVIMRASSRGRRRRDFEASIIIRATIAVGPSRPGCTGPLSFPGFDVGLAVRGALEDAGRGTDLWFRRLQDRLAGGSGPGGEGLAEVTVVGVFGGNHQARARIRDVLPGGQGELGATGVGGGRWFGRTERGEPLARMPTAQFGVGGHARWRWARVAASQSARSAITLANTRSRSR